LTADRQNDNNHCLSLFKARDLIHLVILSIPIVTSGLGTGDLKSSWAVWQEPVHSDLQLPPESDRWTASVVEIARLHRSPLLGTLVSAEGLIITKFSELDEGAAGQPIICRLVDGREIHAGMIRHDPDRDLALIKITTPLDGLSPIEFPSIREAELPKPGTVLISPGFAGTPGRIGIVSSSLTDLSIRQPVSSTGFELGIESAPEAESQFFQQGQNVQQASGVRVTRVFPRTAGESLGLLVDDLIFGINDQRDLEPEALNRHLQELARDQSFRLQICRNRTGIVLRGEASWTVMLTEHDRWGGGPFSWRRFEFGPVIVHDTRLSPDLCGGPLVNLAGEVVGINIARSLRVASLAIPIQQVQKFLLEEMPAEKLPDAPALSLPSPDSGIER
jgi:serine protease Do